VLVAAFCGDELLFNLQRNASCGTVAKFAIAECDRQHARGVRSPEHSLRRWQLNASFGRL
jgi:hypothetical protein